MPCYTTVTTQIRDLALATEAAKKLGWSIESNPERFGQGVSAVFRTAAGTMKLRPLEDGTFQAQGVPRGTVHELSRAYAEEGVMKWARSRGYFAEAQSQGGKKVLTLRKYGG
jgi:hypothetical protein